MKDEHSHEAGMLWIIEKSFFGDEKVVGPINLKIEPEAFVE